MSRRDQHNVEEKVDSSWLLPYADMLTLLLALFIVIAVINLDEQKYNDLAETLRGLFSDGGGIVIQEGTQGLGGVLFIASSDFEDREGTDSSEEQDSIFGFEFLLGLKEEIDEYIINNNLTESLETGLSDEGLLITISTDFSFDPGSAVVKKEGIEIAREISNFLHTDPAHEIIISGHTDDVPMNNEEFRSNWELSVIRAVNFLGYILENENLDRSNFSAKGFGEYRPSVPNTSDENRTKNRRVEVLVLPNLAGGL